MAGANQSEIARLELLHAENPRGRVFAHLAEAYRRAGEAARAREVLRRGLADHPDYPSAHVVLGRVHEDLGDSQAAAAAFVRVLELDPHNMIALRRLARAAELEGRSEEALGYWTELLSLDPSDEEVEASVQALRAELEGGATPGPSGTAGGGGLGDTDDARPQAMDADPETVSDGALPPGEPDPFEEEILLDPGPPIPDAFDDPDIADPPIEIETWDSFAPEAGRGDAAPATGGVPDEDSAPSPDGRDAQPTDGSLDLIDLGSTSLDLPDSVAAAEPEPTAETASQVPAALDEGPAESPPVGGLSTGSLEIEGVSVEALELEDAWPEIPAGGATRSYESGFDADEPDAFGGLETETLADLYAAQGLHGRAAAVYRRLLARTPGDPRLEAKLAEVEARVAEGLEEPVRPEWADAAEPDAAQAGGSTELQGVPEFQDVPGLDDAAELQAVPELEDAPEFEDAPELDDARELEDVPELAVAPAQPPHTDEWAPLTVPESVDPSGDEEPELFVEPTYGEPDDVVLGAEWGEPGGAAALAASEDAAPAAHEPERLWTGEEFGDAFPVSGPHGDAPSGTRSEGTRTGTAWSTGAAQGFGGSAAFFGAAGRIPDGEDATGTGATTETDVSPANLNAEPAGSIAGGDTLPVEGDAEPTPAGAEVHEARAREARPQEAEAFDTTAADDLSDELERALPASAPDTSISDALGALLAWTPGQDARAAEASPDPQEVLTAPEVTDAAEPWQPEGSESSAPDGPPAPPPETSGELATPTLPAARQPSPPAAPQSPTPPMPPRTAPAQTPPDLEAEPWAASPVSGGADARSPGAEGPILELGVDDLVRPPEPPAESRDAAAAAALAAGGSVEPTGAASGEADLGDFARSLLDQSVEPESGEEDEGSDDEELEVFRSWLRSLKK